MTPSRFACRPAGPVCALRRALVVDDDASLREFVGAVLEREGFAALQLATGERALAEARRCPPDILILDLNLPSMSGRELAQEMRGSLATKRVPILVVTGEWLERGDLGDLEDLIDGFLLKPFPPGRLIEGVNNAIELRRLRGSSPLPERR